MNTDIGSALVGVGGGLLGSVFGSIGQARTNRTNLQIARETNAQNYQMFQEQQRWNERMYSKQFEDNLRLWNMQNDYNDAQSQRERLEQAGLNPYMMLNGGSAGQASGIDAPSANSVSPPTMQGATMQNPLNLDSFNSALQNLSANLYNKRLMDANVRKINSEANGLDLSNKWIEPTASAAVDKLRAEHQGINLDNWLKDNSKHYQLETLRNQAWESFEEQRLRNAQVYGTLLDNRAKEILNLYSDEKNTQELLKGWATIQNLDMDTKKKLQELRNLIQVHTKLSMDNKYFGKLFDYMLEADKAKYAYEKLYFGGSVFGYNKAQIDLHTGYANMHNSKRNLVLPITVGHKNEFKLPGLAGLFFNYRRNVDKTYYYNPGEDNGTGNLPFNWYK